MQVVGSILCGLVALRVAVSVIGAVQDRFAKRHRAELSLELMRQQIAAAGALLARREQEQTSWAGYRKFQVAKKVIEAEGVCSFYLEPNDRKPLAAFQPGQYLTLRIDLSDQAKPAIRCYSLSDAPDTDRYRITVKRVPAPRGMDVKPGLISNHLHDHVKPGDILDIQAPRGHFTLDPHTAANQVVLVGGGVGITPLLSMANTVLKLGPERDVWLFYGVHSGRDHAMKEQLRDLVENFDNFQMFVSYSSPQNEDKPGVDYDLEGHMTVEFMKSKLKVSNFEFYVCGPPPMMESIVKDLKKWGVPEHRILTEAFGPATVKKVAKKPDTKSDSAESDAKSTKVKVDFSKSGKTCAWSDDCTNLLDLALDNGVTIQSGCRAGNCGTCEVAVKSGKVEYNVECGAEPAEGVCLTCVAMPQSDLVLDA